MTVALECCRDMPEVELEPGAVLQSEGQSSNTLYVLISGEVQVLRRDAEVATISHPGAVFGEMGILLATPHTVTVKAATPCRVYVIEDAGAFLSATPELMAHISKLLALRLQLAEGYLADLKSQFAEHQSHLSIVDQVLESLLYQQEPAFRPGGSQRDDDIGPE